MSNYCDPRDGSPPGSPVPGILQARTLEWVAISFSNTWKWKVKVKSLSRVWLLATPWTAAYQGPPSMGFSRQEYWSGLPLPSPIPPSIKVFSNESTLRMRWPKYWSFSFSISPSKEHPGLISFRRAGWISLQSKGLSRVFSNNTVQKHQFFSTQLYSPTLTSVHDYWKNHSFD